MDLVNFHRINLTDCPLSSRDADSHQVCTLTSFSPSIPLPVRSNLGKNKSVIPLPVSVHTFPVKRISATEHKAFILFWLIAAQPSIPSWSHTPPSSPPSWRHTHTVLYRVPCLSTTLHTSCSLCCTCAGSSLSELSFVPSYRTWTRERKRRRRRSNVHVREAPPTTTHQASGTRLRDTYTLNFSPLGHLAYLPRTSPDHRLLTTFQGVTLAVSSSFGSPSKLWVLLPYQHSSTTASSTSHISAPRLVKCRFA